MKREPSLEDPWSSIFQLPTHAGVAEHGDDEDDDEALWRRFSVAEGYAELGMYAEAHEELDLADQETGFRLLEVAVRKLDLFLAEGRWKDAAIYGEILTEFDPDEPAHFMKFATALHETGRTDTAIHALSLAPPKLERDPEYQYRLAGYELAAGTREDALFHLENAFALKPELRATALADPNLNSLVAEIPAKPRFIPSTPEYEYAPGDTDEDEDEDEDEEDWEVAEWEVEDKPASFECDPTAKPDFESDSDFECPF